MAKKEKFAIIDANAIIHRAFHALPPLMTKDGVLVNAVYGFANILLKVLKDIKPDYVAVCFDVAKKTFRNKLYVDYKANREKGPQELHQQFVLVRELVAAFNMPQYGIQGYEADDLIGTLIEMTKQERALEKIIVTGDMDALQLVDRQTKVYTLHKGINDTIIYDEKGVQEKYGFGPERVVDYKALRGDPSDNIPGVPGIGKKIATELIKNFGDLDGIYAYVNKINLEQLEKISKNLKIKERIIKLLKEYKSQAYLSRQLATIKRDVKFNFNLSEAKVQPFDAQKLVKLFTAWNFKTLISRIPAAEKELIKGQASLFTNVNKKNKSEVEGQVFKIRSGYFLVDNLNLFSSFWQVASQQEVVALDTESSGLDPFKDKLIGMSFAWQAGRAYYLPIGFINQHKNIQLKIARFLSNPKIKKVGHNIKFDLEMLKQAGYILKGIFFDTMVAAYLLNPGSRQYKLDTLIFSELNYEMTPIEVLIGPKSKDQLNLTQVDIKRVADYAAEDADYTWRLYKILDKRLRKNNLRELMDKIETPLIGVLARMEEHGILVDNKFLYQMSLELNALIKKIENKIYKIAGAKFNVRSPLQLKDVLFNKLKISSTGLSKTKTGISTAASELEKLRGRHKIIDLIEEHRELSKLKSTYTDALPALINPKTHRIHTSFNQTVTATGRLSSSEPNLQNIPIRSELGKKIRRAFVAPEGYKILSLDYSQIELRIAAAMSGDKKMIEAFQRNEDIHTRTAAEVFEVDPDKVSPDMRRRAKEVNFGIIYGLGPRGLAQRTGMSYDEALFFIERYFDIFSGLKEYLEEVIALAHRQEYVETLFGRRRYLPEINAEHQGLRAQAERMALNHPLQGTAADLIKLAMIKIDKIIQKKYVSGEVKMILQVHDELIFEIKNKLASQLSELLKDEMENVYKLNVPIKVDLSLGNNWGECK